MKRFYTLFCKAESLIAGVFLCIVTSLVFLSAIARTIKMPINWAQDISLLLFAWVVFLGADLALRSSDFVNVDLFVSKLPRKVQQFLYYFWYIVIIGFLSILIRFGVPLSISNSKRLFQTLGISYSWAVMSVPVGSMLMIVTIIIKLVNQYKRDRVKRGEI